MTITIKTKEVVDAESSQFMGESGIYPVTIAFASLDQSAKSEAIQVNFHVQYGTGEQTLYGPYVQDSTGKALTIGVNLVSSLGVIAGMGDGEQLEIEEEEHVVGKDKTVKSFAVIQQFTGVPVQVRLQEEYSSYEGEIKKKLVVKEFFREDGASAAEIVNEAEPGTRLKLVQEKYSKNITYKDGLTEADVEAWKKNKKTSKKPENIVPKKSGATLFQKKPQ